jgi:DNA-binding Lrp family transcriptional regulator
MEEIIQYWELTGDQDFLLHVAARDTVHLDKMLSRLGKHGRSTTSLILSVKKKSYQ